MGNNTTRNVTDNERLHAWLFPEQCWHEAHPNPDPSFSNPCKKCGWNCDATDAANPDYASKLGFHDLLDGLKAKGYGARFASSMGDPPRAWAVLTDAMGIAVIGTQYADTLPAALFQAAIKAMQADREPTEG